MFSLQGIKTRAAAAWHYMQEKPILKRVIFAISLIALAIFSLKALYVMTLFTFHAVVAIFGLPIYLLAIITIVGFGICYALDPKKSLRSSQQSPDSSLTSAILS